MNIVFAGGYIAIGVLTRMVDQKLHKSYLATAPIVAELLTLFWLLGLVANMGSIRHMDSGVFMACRK